MHKILGGPKIVLGIPPRVHFYYLQNGGCDVEVNVLHSAVDSQNKSI